MAKNYKFQLIYNRENTESLFLKIDKFKNRLSKASKFFLYKEDIYEKTENYYFSNKSYFLKIEDEERYNRVRKRFINKKEKATKDFEIAKKELIDLLKTPIHINDLWKKSIKFKLEEVCIIKDIDYEYYKTFNAMIREYAKNGSAVPLNSNKYFCNICPVIDVENKKIGYFVDYRANTLSMNNCFFINTDIKEFEKHGEIVMKKEKQISRFDLIDIDI